jgi:hypothetical protein
VVSREVNPQVLEHGAGRVPAFFQNDRWKQATNGRHSGHRRRGEEWEGDWSSFGERRGSQVETSNKGSALGSPKKMRGEGRMRSSRVKDTRPQHTDTNREPSNGWCGMIPCPPHIDLVLRHWELVDGHHRCSYRHKHRTRRQGLHCTDMDRQQDPHRPRLRREAWHPWLHPHHTKQTSPRPLLHANTHTSQDPLTPPSTRTHSHPRTGTYNLSFHRVCMLTLSRACRNLKLFEL